MRTILASTALQKKEAPDADTRARTGAPAGTPLFLRRQAAGPPRSPLQREPPEEALAAEEVEDEEVEDEEVDVQTKLEVNEPGDVWEQEADGVASAVMRQEEPGAMAVQRKPAAAGAAPSGSSVPVPDSGAPLSGAVRERIEPVLGADLGGVRVHSSPEARETARSLQAKAFTHQGHIWLGPGQSADDVELMAHEATHVVQQTGGAAVIQRQGDKSGTKKVSFLGVEDSEAHSRDYLAGMGLHLVNPADHYQNDRDSKGRKVRIERWEDKDGNYLWYRVHEGAALFPVQEASAAIDRIAHLMVTLGDHVSKLTEMRSNGKGGSPGYTYVLDKAFEDQAAIWQEVGKARETLPRWRIEVEGDSRLEAELEKQAHLLEGLAGAMPSLEDMVDDLAINREAPQ